MHGIKEGNRRYLDESENAANPEDSHNPEKCWTDREVGKYVLQEDSHYRCKDKDEIKEVPRDSEVMVPQAYDFYNCLCKRIIFPLD